MSKGYAVIDLETTGLSPFNKDAIVEVAVAVMDEDFNLTETYSTLVKPFRAVAGTEIHRITEDMVEHAPSFHDILPALLCLLDGKRLVAHNAKFEEKFLNSEMRPHGVTVERNNFVDSLAISVEGLSLPNNKLGTVAEYFNVPYVNAHTALADTLILAEIFQHFTERVPVVTFQHIENSTPFSKDSLDTLFGYSSVNIVSEPDFSNWLSR